MLNSTIVANMNGDLTPDQKVSGGLHSSLFHPIQFRITQVKSSSDKGQREEEDEEGNKSKTAEKNGPQLILNGQSRTNNYLDQNRNPQSKQIRMVNGNRNGIDTSEDGIPLAKVHLYNGKILLEWQQVHRIGAGLANLGNTCFMNTVLQCLTYCPPLANYLLYNSDHSSKCRLTGHCMMCELQQHIKKAISHPNESIKPIHIYQKLKIIAKHFQFGRQEDAHEYLRYLIDSLWKSCLSNHEGYTKLDSASKETTIINRIFGGYHRSQVTCLRCREKSSTYDYFMDLMLDVKNNVPSLERALEKFTQPETLQNENAYKCPQCKMKVSAQKRLTVFKPPNVATFQFKRFEFQRNVGKLSKQIAYPETFNLRPYMSNPKGIPVTYRLNAVLVHAGHSCNSGHYFCYVRNSNGFWYLMDDSKVTHVSINQVLNQSAYILFYIKVPSPDALSTKKSTENVPGNMRNGFAGSGHCVTSANSISRSTLNMKSNPLPKMSKLSVSSPANTIMNGTSAKPHHKQALQPLPQKRNKLSFTIRHNNTKGITVPKQPVKNVNPAKSFVNGNTLVPYVEDSSDFSDEDVVNDNVKTASQSLNTNKTIIKPSFSSNNALFIKNKLSKTGTLLGNGKDSNNSRPLTEIKRFPSGLNNLNVLKHKELAVSEKEMEKPVQQVLKGAEKFSENANNNSIREKENSVKCQNNLSTQQTVAPTPVSSASVKVNASTKWNVSEISVRSPSVASGSSTNSVNSTTDWAVIDQDSACRIKPNGASIGNRHFARRPDKHSKMQAARIESLLRKSLAEEKNNSNGVPLKVDSPISNRKIEEVKGTCDSPGAFAKLSKSPATASAPCLNPTSDTTENSRVDNLNDVSQSSVQSMSKPDLSTHLNSSEIVQPFRTQLFHNSDSFLCTSSDTHIKCATPSKNKATLKRPLSDDTEDVSTKRSTGFNDTNENSSGSMHKKLKISQHEDEKHPPLNMLNIYPKAQYISKPFNKSALKLDEVPDDQVCRSDLSKNVLKPGSYSASNERKLKTTHFGHSNYNNNDDDDDSGSNSSGRFSGSKYEYTWVEKEAKGNDTKSNIKASPKSFLSNWKSGNKNNREMSLYQTKNSKSEDVVSELQRNPNQLFGTKVGCWDNARRSPVRENKNRRYFDDYDEELDKGKEKHHKKYKERNHYHNHNPFQSFGHDRRNASFQNKWRTRKVFQKNRYNRDRYYDDRYHKNSHKYYSRPYYNKRHHRN